MHQTPQSSVSKIPPNDTLREKISAEGRSIFRLGAPILVVQLLQVSVVAVDTIMAGRYNAIDLSGVAIGGSTWFPIFLFLFGLLSALTPTVAQHHGAGRYGDIPSSVFQCFWLVMILAPLTMSLLVFIEPLLIAIAADEAIRPITKGYLSAMAVGLPPLLLFNVLRFYSDGVSLTKPAMVASFLSLLVNIPLNYVLIYGKFGFPELGGVGCGWASAISFYVAFSFMLLNVFWNKGYEKFRLFEHIKSMHFDLPTMRHIIKVGLPIGFAHLIEASMFGVIALFLASLGPMVVAAHQIALNVSALVFMIPLSLSIALTIRIGFLIGAQELKEARFCAFFGLALAVIYATTSASLLFLFRHHIAGLYNKDATVISLAAALLVYAALFQLGDSLQATAAGALRGYKDTRPAMLIMMLAFWCFGLPLGYFLGLSEKFFPAMHAEGFWIGLVVGLFAAGTLLVTRLHFVSLKMSLRST